MTEQQMQGPPDAIGGPSRTLEGMKLEYSYSTGARYLLEFGPEQVTFTRRAPVPADPFSVPYRARDLPGGLIMVHWIVKHLSAHVTLIVDLERRELHASAMMPPNKSELFDLATIESVEGA